LRYYGVDTTERGQPCYDEATARNRALSGGVVRLVFDERERDAHGRLLAYVFTEAGLSVDAQLVAEGMGRAWKRDGGFRDRLVALEEKAKDAKIGCLWSGAPVPEKRNQRRKRRTRA
jgi:endonuclease YncB( thermonuclease family)